MNQRLSAAATACLLLVTGLAGVALAVTETAADDFSSGGYGGSTGTIDWASNWTEVGEPNDPGGGSVRVQTDAKCASGQCLTIDQLLGLASMGAQRSLDLSDATSATLGYHVEFPDGGLPLLSGAAVVDVNTGSGWSELARHGPGIQGHQQVSLPVGDVVTIRFRAVDLSLTANMAFDDVEVEMELPEPTTSTTSTSSSTTSSTTTTSTTTTTRRSTSSSTTSTTSTTATPGSPSTTAPTEDRAGTSGEDRTTTTTRPGREAEDGTTTTVLTASEEEPPPTSTTALPIAGDEEGEDRGSGAVVRSLDPGLRATGHWTIDAQDDLLVVFGLAVEDIALDILASAVLGLVLAWVSVRRLG